MTKQRTPGAGARESAFDLSILGTACAFAFPLIRSSWPSLPEGTESTGTALVMAIGGAVARYLRKKKRVG